MIRLSGNQGILFTGYQVAAILGEWDLVREDKPIGNEKSVLLATFIKVDYYWILEKPTKLALRLGSHCWVWEKPIVRLGTMAAEIELVGNPAAIEIQYFWRTGHGT